MLAVHQQRLALQAGLHHHFINQLQEIPQEVFLHLVLTVD
jgi:hypothetical protein